LPSGRRAAITSGHILRIEAALCACPEGHFWFQTPDLAINAPPVRFGQDVICDYAHAPVPESPEEMARYIPIIEDLASGEPARTGRWLDSTERPIGWTEEDWTGFVEWHDEARDAVLRALSLDQNDSVSHMLMPELKLPEKNMEGD
jgi:hypothetical protein